MYKIVKNLVTIFYGIRTLRCIIIISVTESYFPRVYTTREDLTLWSWPKGQKLITAGHQVVSRQIPDPALLALVSHSTRVVSRDPKTLLPSVPSVCGGRDRPTPGRERNARTRKSSRWISFMFLRYKMLSFYSFTRRYQRTQNLKAFKVFETDTKRSTGINGILKFKRPLSGSRF